MESKAALRLQTGGKTPDGPAPPRGLVLASGLTMTTAMMMFDDGSDDGGGGSDYYQECYHNGRGVDNGSQLGC